MTTIINSDAGINLHGCALVFFTEKADGEEKHSSGLVRNLLFSILPYPVEDRGGWGFNRPLTSETGAGQWFCINTFNPITGQCEREYRDTDSATRPMSPGKPFTHTLTHTGMHIVLPPCQNKV